MILRAYPKFRGDNPWYDYCMVEWQGYGLVPAKCLCFFRVCIKDEDNQESHDGDWVLIHSCSEQQENIGECSIVLTCWNLELEKDKSPKLHKVHMNTIQRCSFVIETKRQILEKYMNQESLVWVINDRED